MKNYLNIYLRNHKIDIPVYFILEHICICSFNINGNNCPTIGYKFYPSEIDMCYDGIVDVFYSI